MPDGRGRRGKHRRGSSHPRSKNGISISEHGYVRGQQVGKSHPLADPNGYAYLHQLVVVVDDEVVHHRNEDKADNRLENLAHNSLHDSERPVGSVIFFLELIGVLR